LARVPRLARLIGRLPPERAKRLSLTATEADVFWEVYNFDTNDPNEECGLLADGLKAKLARRLAWPGRAKEVADGVRTQPLHA
jgi:hypothetical protein